MMLSEISEMTEEQLRFWRSHHLSKLEVSETWVKYHRGQIREIQHEMIKRKLSLFDDEGSTDG